MANDLDGWRKEIDEVDAAIIKLYARRFQLTQEVGVYKRDHQLPPVDPSRETAQLARIQQLAKEVGLDPTFAAALLRLAIDHAVANHRALRQAD